MRVCWTTQYSYKGPDRLDVTVKTGIKAFAPTWEMVLGYKSGILSKQKYEEQYIALLTRSWKENRAEWEKLLRMSEVTLVCFCKPGNFCHRVLLATVMEKCGFVYKGERNLD